MKLHVGDYLWSPCVHKFFTYLSVCDHQTKLQSLVQPSFLYLAISQKDPGICMWPHRIFIGCLDFNYFFFPEHSNFALVASCGRQVITQAKCSYFAFIVSDLLWSPNFEIYHGVKLHVGDFLWSPGVHKFFMYLSVCDHQTKLQSLVQPSFLYLATSQKDPGICI